MQAARLCPPSVTLYFLVARSWIYPNMKIVFRKVSSVLALTHCRRVQALVLPQGGQGKGSWKRQRKNRNPFRAPHTSTSLYNLWNQNLWTALEWKPIPAKIDKIACLWKSSKNILLKSIYINETFPEENVPAFWSSCLVIFFFPLKNSRKNCVYHFKYKCMNKTHTFVYTYSR